MYLENSNIFLGILVFDAAKDRSWRLLHASMLPNPDETTYKVRIKDSII